MTRLAVVPPYAAALAILFVILSFRVINARRAARIAIGTAGDPGLERLTRVQANFAEYVPIALILLLIAETRGAWPLVLHALCAALLAARLAHAFGVSRPPEDFRFRVAGMVATLTVIVVAALLVLVT